MQYTTLISVDQLASLMASHNVHHPLIVFDCRFSLADTALGRGKYESGHIPTAIYVHLDHDLAGNITPHSGRHPLPKVEDFIRRISTWEINNRTQIVVYDDAGGAIASRLWWMMKWVGHTRVALLDGGYAAWQNGVSAYQTSLNPPANPIVRILATVIGKTSQMQTQNLSPT